MKPVDWILLIISIWSLYRFIGGAIFTSEVLYKMRPNFVHRELMKRFIWFILPIIIFVWHRWG